MTCILVISHDQWHITFQIRVHKEGRHVSFMEGRKVISYRKKQSFFFMALWTHLQDTKLSIKNTDITKQWQWVAMKENVYSIVLLIKCNIRIGKESLKVRTKRQVGGTNSNDQWFVWHGTIVINDLVAGSSQTLHHESRELAF